MVRLSLLYLDPEVGSTAAQVAKTAMAGGLVPRLDINHGQAESHHLSRHRSRARVWIHPKMIAP